MHIQKSTAFFSPQPIPLVEAPSHLVNLIRSDLALSKAIRVISKIYQKNEFLSLPTEQQQAIFYVETGKVKFGYYDSSGRAYMLDYCNQHEMVSFSNTPFWPTPCDFAVVMQNQTVVHKIILPDSLVLPDHISQLLLKNTYSRLRKMERRMQLLMIREAKGRLVEFLKDLGRQSTLRFGDTVKIKLDLTQGDIAELVNLSRKSVSVIFGALINEGFLKVNRREIVIPDFSRFCKLHFL